MTVEIRTAWVLIESTLFCHHAYKIYYMVKCYENSMLALVYNCIS